MSDTPSFTNSPALERYLMSVSPETDINWFAVIAKTFEGEGRPMFRSAFDVKLVLQLMTRREPLIDLAVAAYCDQHEPLETLWNSGDPVIRTAIAHNTTRSGFSGLPTSDAAELCS